MIFKEIDNTRDVGVICHYFRNYHVFEYSATNINRRDAEFAETWKFTLLPALEKNSIFLSK